MELLQESNSESENEVRVKKRRNEKEWKRNNIKRLKAEGKVHINWAGKAVRARITGAPCGCKKKCFEKFSDAGKEHILKEFNCLGSGGNKVAPDSHLQALVKPQPILRRRPRKSDGKKRSGSYVYRILLGTVEYVVCLKAFCSLHGVTVDRVRRLANLASKGLLPREQRGKHHNRPNAVSLATQNLMGSHIRMFPYRVGHYSNVAKKRRYLSATLSVRKMYELFLKSHDPGTYAELLSKNIDIDKVKGLASYRCYLQYFRDTFNYGFGRPQVDKCRKCEELKVKVQHEKSLPVRNKLTADLKLHKLKAGTFYTELSRCTKLSQDEEDTEMITFDFEQNIPVPITNVTDEFYLRQMWIYNFGVHRMSDNKQVMYMYTEADGKKGCSEVVSLLKHYIDNYVPETIRKLYVFSDGCTGQNRNHTLVEFWYSLVQLGRFTFIEQRYPVRGHSYLPNDRDFSLIERVKRKQEKVETPEEWYNIVREGTKFEVVEVKQRMLFDFQTHLQTTFKKTVINKGSRGHPPDKFLISESKVLRYSSNHKNTVQVSKTMQGSQWSQFSIQKPNTTITWPSVPKYANLLPMKKAKIADLQKLMMFLTEKSQEYYRNVFTESGNVILPEEVESESDTEYL